MKKKVIVVILIVFISLLTRFYCGIYVHDEFAENHFFIKYRPAWKWKFYSPIGQSDLKIEDLTPEKQIEQKYFDEFVGNQGLSR